ncbi:hypothetical protein BDAP_001852 [Binucleata daphniae]
MFLFYFTFTFCSVRFLYLPAKTQPIKTIEQTKDYTKYVLPSFRKFNNTPGDVFSNRWDIFQIRNNNTLISSLYIAHKYFYSNIKRDAICFYTVFTNKDYRGKGYAKKLLNYSIQIMMKKYKNPLLCLHLNPEDETMNLNYAMYYSLGFRKGAISEYGSECYILRYDEIAKMKDVRQIDIVNEKEKGYFLAMFCEPKDFNIKNKLQKELLVEGEEIRKKLFVRKEQYDKEENEQKIEDERNYDYETENTESKIEL